ncbi:MAG: 2-dehydropantoate 2-reductase [Proteobacteria bacterium]|nr:2-dehydropantoate 2-reductase [Pseudomonadota bacterium]
MKIAMLGSGGVGGYFGARLAAAGEAVTFIARGAHLAAMRENGLKVKSGLGDVHIQPTDATDDTAAVGAVDTIVIAVKLWDTEAAGRAALPMIGPGTTVVSLQNGVECNDILGPIVGGGRLIGGLAQIAATIEAPGVISHLGTMGRITIGELGGGTSDRVAAFHDACAEAGIESATSDDIERVIWEKFVFLVGLSGTTALRRQPVGPIREDGDGRAFLLSVMAEAVAVGRAKGIGLDAGFAEERLRFIDGLPYDMAASMYHDLMRENRLELDWLGGAVVRFGAGLGVPTPVNRVVYAALKPFAGGGGGA